MPAQPGTSSGQNTEILLAVIAGSPQDAYDLDTYATQRSHIEALARAHRILHAQRTRKHLRDHKQPELF